MILSINRTRLRSFCLAFALCAAGMLAESPAQTSPAQTVQRFKTLLDAAAADSLCRMMADPDTARPLTARNFTAMHTSMEQLITLWRYEAFSIGSAVVDESRVPPRAQLTAKVFRLKQEVRFTLLRIDSAWYIRDIEIFFK